MLDIMGELSKPMMTPLGVLYRSLCDSDREALKYAEWAVKLFGGEASQLNLVGPNPKGMFEAGLLATVPATAKCMKARKAGEDTSWYATPEKACVLFDALETPAAFYFPARDLLFKPGSTPPMTAFFVLDLNT